MIRDLAEQGVQMVREEKKRAVQAKAEEQAEEKLLDLLLPQSAQVSGTGFSPASEPKREGTREKLRGMLRAGGLDDRQIELDVADRPAAPTMQIFGNQGMEEMGVNLQEIISNLPFGKKTKKRKLSVPEARKLLAAEEAAKLVDDEAATREAIERVQSSGIIFIDEIDKVATPGGGGGEGRGPDVSHRRGQHGQHQVRAGEDRSHPLHRGGRVSRREGERSAARTAGPLPDPRRAGVARRERFGAHPDAATERDDQAGDRAARHRRDRARV